MTDNLLLLAVEALTKPQHVHVMQTDEDGKWLGNHTVTHLPLLTQLEHAIRQSMNKSASSGQAAHERNLLDADALMKSLQISATIRDWCRMRGVEATRPPKRDLTVDLNRWYVAHENARRAGQVTDDFYLSELRRWESLILGKLNPPRVLELLSPCPICGATEWEDENGNLFKFPLNVEYRKGDDGQSVFDNARAICKACEAVWKGSTQLRALRYDIDVQDSQREAS